MLHLAYAVLVCLAFYLNRRDRRMLLLTAAVTVSVFLPAPRHSAVVFYAFCVAAECLVALVAHRCQCAGSRAVIWLCALLVLNHLMGYSLDGSTPLSPYRAVVKLLETSQLVACMAFSPTLVHILRNRDESTTRPRSPTT